MRINLLPPEILERHRARRRTFAVAVAGLVVLALIGVFYLFQLMRLGEVRDEVENQEAENAEIQAEINELQDIEALQQEAEATRLLLNQLLADRVLWSGVLRDVSLVIPGRVWLTGMTGQLGAASAPTATTGTTPPPATTTTVTDEATGTGTGVIGQITFTGFGFEHRDVALWLSRLEDVRGFLNPWASSSTKSLIGTTEVVQFTSSVDLSEQAIARRVGDGE